MDMQPEAAAFRLPIEPYPGLRPFLEHEAALLLGRGRQLREIIDRLRETHFVAVIGGSGSGKSSLIRAGVVPKLRGLGIPDAGDYWVSVVCTPGTTRAVIDVGDDPSDVAPQTPITRLAWKFSQLLEPAEVVLERAITNKDIDPSPSLEPDIAATQRRADIAAGFRQSAGFKRLVDAYSSELPALGPDREHARFLFVIDQFEELFHPNNRDNDDANVLVQAVIDHFFNPHPRCFVVLTMRSEHLADCAGYLELPDAINKSSYLVRRLDAAELREAIVGPAKYFLRLQQRGGAAVDGPLPDDVVFDDHVIERLLSDVDQINDDPDHLPLLQHLLARTWAAASRRSTPEGEALRFPGHVEWVDFEHAVDPHSRHSHGWLRKQLSTNALRASLENWAEASFQQRSVEERKLIDVVLRHLAFKDPNNGQYTQQRLEVDDPRLFEGEEHPAALLYGLLGHGFIDSVNYLFWDDENGKQVTLKVSHESFIRGWKHFRDLVDAEAQHFEEFVAVLRRCEQWKVDEQPELLLEAAELRRFERAGLEPVFAVRAERSEWFRVLEQYRSGERYTAMEPFVNNFLDLSRSRVQAEEQKRRDDEEQRRELREQAAQAQRDNAVKAAENRALESEIKYEREKSLRKLILGLATGLLLLVVALIAVSESMLAAREGQLHLGYAMAAETQATLRNPVFIGFDAARKPLRHALEGAHFFQTGVGYKKGPAAAIPLKYIYSYRIDSMGRAELLSEVRNIASLQSVLRSTAWLLTSPAFKATSTPKHPQKCNESDSSPAYFYAGPSATGNPGLIITNPIERQERIVAAGERDENGNCSPHTPLPSIPVDAVRVGVADDLSNLVLEFDRPDGPDDRITTFQFLTILWDGSQSAGAVYRTPIDQLVKSSRPREKDNEVKQLASAYGVFATDLQIDDKMVVRLFDMEPTLIADSSAKLGQEMLRIPGADTVNTTTGQEPFSKSMSVCHEFAKAQTPDFEKSQVFSKRAADDPRTYCLLIKHNETGPNEVSGNLLLASLFVFEDEAGAANSDKHWGLFFDQVVGEEMPEEMRINVHDGWFAFKGANGKWRAVPWSLNRWRALASDVLSAPDKSVAGPDLAKKEQPFALLLAEIVPDSELKAQATKIDESPKKIGTAMVFE